MSVLLKGLKMPKEGENVTIKILGRGEWFDSLDYEQYGEAVEVPTPHGSLIDSEEFKNMLALGVMTAQMLGSDENTSLDIHFMKEILKEMPTVIKAEE